MSVIRAGSAETARLREAYTRRAEGALDACYSYFEPANLYLFQKRERAILAALRRHRLTPLAGRRVLDIGCGDGSVLRDLVRYGATPRCLEGADLLPERIQRAQELGPHMRFTVADAQALPYPEGAFDLALAFTLFSSVVDEGARRRVAAEALRVLRPGGVLLLYDFWINPGNPDVRRLRARHIRELFAGHSIDLRRVTLAPPIARALARWSWLACELLEKIPILRTHYLAVIIKRSG